MRLKPVSRQPKSVALVLALPAVALLWACSGQPHASLPWQSNPDRIHFCGRNYLRSGSVRSRADIDSQVVALPGDDPYPVTEIGRVPPLFGHPVLTNLTPAGQRRRLGVSCAMVLYRQADGDQYTSYVLLGGP